MKKWIQEKWLFLMNFLPFLFGRIVHQRYQMLWLIGLLSEGIAVITMILTGPNDFLWLFLLWGLASAFLVGYSSRRF